MRPNPGPANEVQAFGIVGIRSSAADRWSACGPFPRGGQLPDWYSVATSAEDSARFQMCTWSMVPGQ